MIKYRPLLLVLVGLALAAAVWFDNRDMLLSLWYTDAIKANSRVAAEAKPSSEPIANDAQKRTLPAADALLTGNPLASFDKATLENWVDRPLFAPSRKRPPPQPVQKGNVALPPPPDYQLVGVVLNADRAVALLRGEGNGANFHVEVGDVLAGWHVTSVDRDTVTLKRDDETSQIIHFKKDCADAPGSVCP